MGVADRSLWTVSVQHRTHVATVTLTYLYTNTLLNVTFFTQGFHNGRVNSFLFFLFSLCSASRSINCTMFYQLHNVDVHFAQCFSTLSLKTKLSPLMILLIFHTHFFIVPIE